MTKVLIIFNPVAGRKYPKNFKVFALKFLHHFLPEMIFDWRETRPTLAEQLEQLNFTDYSRLIIISGDGTIKDVANYLLKHQLDLPLGIIPAGSANILASSLNIPHSFKQAIKTACLGQEKMIDVCRLNNQEYFLTCLSLGHWTKIIQKTKQTTKSNFSFFAYFWNLLKYWRIKSTLFFFNLDGKNYQISGHTLVVANALSVLKFQPQTPVDLTDGQLEILINRNKTLLGFLILIPAFFFGKTRFPLLFKAKGQKISVDLSSLTDKTVQIDGEIRIIEKIEIEIVPQKLRVIC